MLFFIALKVSAFYPSKFSLFYSYHIASQSLALFFMMNSKSAIFFLILAVELVGDLPLLLTLECDRVNLI
jgi:hypothetical protein